MASQTWPLLILMPKALDQKGRWHLFIPTIDNPMTTSPTIAFVKEANVWSAMIKQMIANVCFQVSTSSIVNTIFRIYSLAIKQLDIEFCSSSSLNQSSSKPEFAKATMCFFNTAIPSAEGLSLQNWSHLCGWHLHNCQKSVRNNCSLIHKDNECHVQPKGL